MFVRALLSMAMTVSIVFASQQTVCGADAEVGGLVEELFDVGWNTAIKSRAEADAKWEEIKQLAPTDSRATLAYALVKLKQRQYSQAATALDDAVGHDEQNLPAWKAKITLDILMKNYAAAMVAMNKVGQLLGEPALNDEAIRLDVADFLGRATGFLERPAGNLVDEAQLTRMKTEVAANFNDKERALFDEKRRDVLAQYASFIGEKEETETAAQAEAEADQEKLLADLEQQRARIEARENELGPIRDELRKEAKSELEKIAEEERPLITQFQQLEREADVIRRELFLVDSDINRLRAQAAREKDPATRDRLLREADRISIFARRYDTDLALLDRRATAVNVQRAQIQAKYRQTQAEYANKIGQIDAELAELGKQTKRNDIEMKKGQRDPRGDTRESREIATRAQSLGTYYSFPLEGEKQRILDSLR